MHSPALPVFAIYEPHCFSNSLYICPFFLGFEIAAHGILIIVVSFLNVEKNIKEEQELIARRKGQI